MPPAVVLTTASKAGTAGGTFGDVLVANAGDVLAVANFDQGGAAMIEAWGMDSTSVAEAKFVYTRPEATHDQQHGLRFMVQALFPGGAGKPAAHEFLPGLVSVELFKSDVPVISVSTTAGDNILVSWLTKYDDLPGASGMFATWAQIAAMQKSTVGIRVDAVASATVGAYGAQRAFNADDDRLHANTWYAVLGYTTQTPVTTITLIGPDWGGQRIGGPGSPEAFRTGSWFVDQSLKWNMPLIPVFNSNNKANVLVQIADDIANTSPKIDFLLYELTGNPLGGA